MLSCWWVTKRKQNSSICVLLLFSLSAGMFLEQKHPEEKLTQGGRKRGKRQPQCLYTNSRNLTRTNYLPECGKICEWITLEALSKGQTCGSRYSLQCSKQWENSIPHTTSHCVYSDFQNQNGLLMNGLWAPQRGSGPKSSVGDYTTFWSLPSFPKEVCNANTSNELCQH